MKRLVLFLTSLALISDGISQATAAPLYGADNARTTNSTAHLYLLNQANGAVLKDIGPIGFTMTGLAFEPATGVLYGSTDRQDPTVANRAKLITINPYTGAGTLVGSFGLAGQTMADISFNPVTGVLYGWSPGSDDLYTINKATGAATLVGDSGLAGTFGSGLDINSSGTPFFTGSGGAGPLRTIDKSTGAPTTVATLSGAPLGGDAIVALDFDPDPNSPDFGKLFGVQFHAGAAHPSSFLITIDTTTGVITSRGQSVDAMDAMAIYVPEPSSSVLVILGIIGIARRKRHR